MTEPGLNGFEGISFVSSDLEATKCFWVDYLGGTLVAEGTDDGRRPSQVVLGGALLEFYRAQPGEAPAPGGPNHQHQAWDIEPEEWDLWAARSMQWNAR